VDDEHFAAEDVEKKFQSLFLLRRVTDVGHPGLPIPKK